MSNTSSKPFRTVDEAWEWFHAEAGEPVWTGQITDGTDALSRIRVIERRIAMLQGEQVLAMSEWITGATNRFGAERPDWVDPQEWAQSKEAEYAELSAYAEVALELGLADRTSNNRVAIAVDLVNRLPATVAALCAGRITLAKARVIREETANLDRALLGRVEAQVLDKAQGLTFGNLRRATRRSVERADKDAVAKRQAKAVAERKVRVWDIGDGMSELHAVLPNAGAEALWAVLDATAHQAVTPGDERTIDQVRADALIDLVCFPDGAAPRISYQVQVISPDPDLNADATRRLPNAAQARYIKARDQHCVHPGCRVTRTEDDHTIDWAKGGPTLTTNLGLRCKRHHVLKGLPGWKATQEPDGTMTLTTPSGRTYRTRPPDKDGIDQPVEKIPPPPPESEPDPIPPF